MPSVWWDLLWTISTCVWWTLSTEIKFYVTCRQRLVDFLSFKKLFLIKKKNTFVRSTYIWWFLASYALYKPFNHMLWVTFQTEIKSETKQRLQEDHWLLTLSFHVAYREVFHDKLHLSTLRCCLNDHFLLLHGTKHTCVMFCPGVTCTGIFFPSVAQSWCYVIVVNFVVLRLTKKQTEETAS